MIRTSILAAAILPLMACGAPEPFTPSDSQEEFWTALSSHCGNAYAGEIVSEDERDADWQGREMVAHWSLCDEGLVAIAFHMQDPDRPDGWDRSRTWVVSRMGTITNASTEDGSESTYTTFLRLKHDHRHDDGKPDAVTQYGGDTAEAGSASAQDFPVDQESIDMFTREGLDASLTNVWRLEVTPAGDDDAHFTYQLTRRNDPTRLFRVRFDASTPIDAPPAAWGWE